MTWDPVWERIFQERADWGRYPPEELVRFIAKNYYQAEDRRAIKILEIGCGPGGGPSWYLAREGFSLYGIDGSRTAIEKARRRFHDEGLGGEFTTGSLAALPWPDETFDCAVDVACLQCNTEEGTKIIVQQLRRVLKPGGGHFSLTAKAGCWGDGTGIPVDSTSYRDVREGPFSGMGTVRFATKASLLALYAEFNGLELNHSVRSVDNGARELANWIVTCSK